MYLEPIGIARVVRVIILHGMLDGVEVALVFKVVLG